MKTFGYFVDLGRHNVRGKYYFISLMPDGRASIVPAELMEANGATAEFRFSQDTEGMTPQEIDAMTSEIDAWYGRTYV